MGHVLSPKSTTGKGDRMTVKPTRTFLKLMFRFISKEASGEEGSKLNKVRIFWK